MLGMWDISHAMSLLFLEGRFIVIKFQVQRKGFKEGKKEMFIFAKIKCTYSIRI